MRILITGASGTIGHAIAGALLRDGHHVVCVARSSARVLEGAEQVLADFASVPSSEWWRERLTDVDVVINAAGIFFETAVQTFQAVHAHAPIELFNAAVDEGVGLVIQISALGSDEGAVSDFHKSKRLADDALRQLPVHSVVVQPSLVYSPLGQSATLFNQLALLPVTPLPATDALVQPVHLSDLVDSIVNLVDAPPTQSCTVAAVGPHAMKLKEYVILLRCSLGVNRPPLLLEMPRGLIGLIARVAALLRYKLLNPSALEMLERGNHSDPTRFSQILRRPPRPVQRFLDHGERDLAREYALISTFITLMKIALALVWIVTGVLSLGVYPTESSMALLREFGLSGGPATVALYSGGLIDLVLGVALLLAPLRSAHWILAAQFALMAAYTLLISVQMPHWWLHPFGPILKNLPIFVGTGMLIALSRRP